jgi:hypothetical protein
MITGNLTGNQGKIWLAAGLAILIASFPKSGFAASDDSAEIIFPAKSFYDSAQPTGDGYVYITGRLSGDGIGYRNNTISVSCYQDRNECFSSTIEQIGPNQIGRLDSPTIFDITKWDANEVSATEGNEATDCQRTTIIIARKTEKLRWIAEPMNQSRLSSCKDAGDKTYNWTIESPPYR